MCFAYEVKKRKVALLNNRVYILRTYFKTYKYTPLYIEIILYMIQT
jgi:hypothetical protein